jgi:hypothetical protein
LRLCHLITQSTYEHVYAFQFLSAIGPIQHDSLPRLFEPI